jgi:hypothetical protein
MSSSGSLRMRNTTIYGEV